MAPVRRVHRYAFLLAYPVIDVLPDGTRYRGLRRGPDGRTYVEVRILDGDVRAADARITAEVESRVEFWRVVGWPDDHGSYHPWEDDRIAQALVREEGARLLVAPDGPRPSRLPPETEYGAVREECAGRG